MSFSAASWYAVLESCVPEGARGLVVALSGGADSAALLEGLAALGVTLLTVGVNGPDYDLSDAEALCRWRDRA